MIELKRQGHEGKGFVLTIGDKQFVLSLTSLRVLYRRLKAFRIWEDDLNKSSFGSKIRAFREDRHLTQTELAQMLGVTKMEVLRWENGKNEPSRLAIDKLREKGVI